MDNYRSSGDPSAWVAGSEGKGIVLVIGRVVAALAILMVGGLVIYMFGAGFFSGYGIGLPTPWNVVGTVVLSLVLVFVCWHLVRGPVGLRRHP